MSVNGIGENYYQNNVATAKSTKSVNSTEKAINAGTKNEGAVSSSKQMEPEYANYTKEAIADIFFTFWVDNVIGKFAKRKK